jgi:hypothetical protein
MHLIGIRMLIAFLGLFLLALPFDGNGGERGRGCRKGDILRIQDLDVSPDPLVEGQRIKAWRVRIRLNGNRECETEILVREGDEVVGRVRDQVLRPGVNDIVVQPMENYRFQRNEHCFEVTVDLEGSRRRVDADRRFCAKQRAAWSMRERDDQRRGAFR